MKINHVSPSFGIKFPIKTVVESASGMFLDSHEISNPRQVDFFEKVSGLNAKKLYLGELTDGLRNLSRIVKEKYPEIAKASDNIRAKVNKLNLDRTFKPKDEQVFINKMNKIVDTEIKNTGLEEIDMDKVPLADLGLSKYVNL